MSAGLNMQSEDRLITRAELRKILNVTSETLRRWRKANKLPNPDIQLSRRTEAWRLSTLRAAGLNLI